jgi:hypothetical protein
MLDIMDDAIVKMGKQLRKFESITCTSFWTYELEREVQARTGTTGSKVSNTRKVISNRLDISCAILQKKAKGLSLSTYKYHALGDYVQSIRMFGTTDSYSTQTVSIGFQTYTK